MIHPYSSSSKIVWDCLADEYTHDPNQGAIVIAMVSAIFQRNIEKMRLISRYEVLFISPKLAPYNAIEEADERLLGEVHISDQGASRRLNGKFVDCYAQPNSIVLEESVPKLQKPNFEEDLAFAFSFLQIHHCLADRLEKLKSSEKGALLQDIAQGHQSYWIRSHLQILGWDLEREKNELMEPCKGKEECIKKDDALFEQNFPLRTQSMVTALETLAQEQPTATRFVLAGLTHLRIPLSNQSRPAYSLDLLYTSLQKRKAIILAPHSIMQVTRDDEAFFSKK